MGEYAEMMLDGTCCECCGAFLGDEAQGFPRYCSLQCARDRGSDDLAPLTTADAARVLLAKWNSWWCGEHATKEASHD